MSPGTERERRVKLTLIKNLSTAEGLVLEYLQSQHPLKLSGTEGAMITLLQYWLPLAMKERGVTKEEYQKAAAYSVHQLLAQVDWIMSECELPPLSLRQSDLREMPRKSELRQVLAEVPSVVSDHRQEVTPSLEADDESVEDDDSWLDEEDDSGIDFSKIRIDAGFRT